LIECVSLDLSTKRVNPNRSMKTCTLYPLLFCWVLLAAGCAGKGSEEAPSQDAAAQAQAAQDSVFSEPHGEAAHRILILGNSIAAGYGLDPEQAFPARLQEKIDSLGWDFHVVNAGVSGETTAGGLSRLDWLLRQPVDVLIIELGGNDGLRGIASDVTRQNLQAIVDKTQARYPEAEIVLAGMQIPPNLGPEYTERFRSIFPDLARENDLHLVPFLLEGVGGVPALNLPDGIHPTAEGHRIVASNVWDTLEPVLGALRDPDTAAADCEAPADVFAVDTTSADC
jgi:acyl-CoA thioesterase-1